MGFMDKAKKMAEQAQQKLDEVQEQFNQGQKPGEHEKEQEAVRYDKHGRPIEEGPPAGEAPPPPAQPAKGSGGDSPDSSPDPFKPIQ
jgi:hypothetical protein